MDRKNYRIHSLMVPDLYNFLSLDGIQLLSVSFPCSWGRDPFSLIQLSLPTGTSQTKTNLLARRLLDAQGVEFFPLVELGLNLGDDAGEVWCVLWGERWWLILDGIMGWIDRLACGLQHASNAARQVQKEGRKQHTSSGLVQSLFGSSWCAIDACDSISLSIL